jgi:hypothetical protein
LYLHCYVLGALSSPLKTIYIYKKNGLLESIIISGFLIRTTTTKTQVIGTKCR